MTSASAGDRFLITIANAVATYGVSERTVRRWLAEGRLTRFTRQGDRRHRVDRREIERLREWREDSRAAEAHRAALMEWLDELDAKHGAPTAEQIAEARALIDAATRGESDAG